MTEAPLTSLQNVAAEKRILIVSHQLPYVCTYIDNEWKLSPRFGHSALYAGIQGLADSQKVLHVGWTGFCLDSKGSELDIDSNPEMKNSLTQVLSKLNTLPVFLSRQTVSGHYEGYCKTEYKNCNLAFAKAIASAYNPETDLIWVHDYHLLLVPEMIREMIPSAVIGFFLHTPFPSSEIFRCLPSRKEILRGVLRSNLIGFQTYSYARHFISSCTRVLGIESTPKGVEYEGCFVTVGVFPIGIDVARLKEYSKSQKVMEKINSFQEMFKDKKIIFGRDKMDEVNGLHAFEKYLELYPEQRNKVILVQSTIPPPQPLPKLESQINELVSKINALYGSLEFTPIRHFHQHLDQEDYVALLTLSDVALVTSIRDSMNATTYEYVVCQEELQNPLILSEFTATAGSLPSALLVNPWDYEGVANAINDALTMSKEEKSNRHNQLYQHVVSHSAVFWSMNFVRELVNTIYYAPDLNPTPPLNISRMVETFSKSKKRLLLFDYDGYIKNITNLGTLTPITKTPSAALPPKETIDALEILTKDPRNHIYIISGRDRSCLELWLGHIKSAEHGCFLKHAGEDDKWINLMENVETTWKNEVLDIFNYYTERTPGSFIEFKTYSITWHYRLADPDFGAFQARECHNHLENTVAARMPVEVMVGKKNLEVRPISTNKGEIVRTLISIRSDYDFIFCVGDDKTDEDMFRVLKNSYKNEEGEEGNNLNVDEKNDADNSIPIITTCTIGPSLKITSAAFYVEQPKDLIRLMTLWSNIDN